MSILLLSLVFISGCKHAGPGRSHGASPQPTLISLDKEAAIKVAKEEYNKTVIGSEVFSRPEKYEVKASIVDGNWKVDIIRYELSLNYDDRSYIIDRATNEILETFRYQ
jgi:hypothetical protein